MKLPYGKDSISVWKRTVYVRARIYPTEINGEVSQEGEDEGVEEEEEMEEEDGSESESEDDEDEEEEEEGEENKIHPPLSHGTDTLAVTYMSIADLNKLREDSETKSKSKLNGNDLSSKENSKSNSKLNLISEVQSEINSKSQKKRKIELELQKANSKDLNIENAEVSTDHVTYMSIADLNALREASSSSSKEHSTKAEQGSGLQKRGREEIESDDSDDEEEEEEEEEVARKGSSKKQKTFNYFIDEQMINGNRFKDFSHYDDNNGNKKNNGNKRNNKNVEIDDNDDRDYEEEGYDYSQNRIEEVERSVSEIREDDLDRQYEESDNKLWAAIPYGTCSKYSMFFVTAFFCFLF